MYLPKNKVVNILRTEYSSWVAQLTDEEKRAVRKYSYNSMENGPTAFFKRLNAMLRGEYNKADSQLLSRYAEIISGAIRRHPVQNNIICYRGTDKDMTKGLKPGTIFRINQFLSTSVLRSRVFKKKFTYVIYVKQGTRGAYIESLSFYKEQREFLLDKNCEYRLLSRRGNVVELEVVV